MALVASGFDRTSNVAHTADASGAGINEGDVQSGLTHSGFDRISVVEPTDDIGPLFGVSASFVASVPDPSTAPRTVLFDASESTGEIEKYAWDFGDGNTQETTGATLTHKYAAFNTYTVSLTVSQTVEGLLIESTQTQSVAVLDTRLPPIESKREVLQLERGQYPYDPLYTTGGDAKDAAASLRVYGAASGVASGAEATIIEHTAERPLTLRNVPVGGSCDGLFRLLVDDADVVTARRVHDNERGTDILAGATVYVEEGSVIKVTVLNEASASAPKYEATLIGRRKVGA